jgi:hypothetical protein
MLVLVEYEFVRVGMHPGTVGIRREYPEDDHQSR